MTLNFEQWLVGQQSREDLIGDLAREPSMQRIDQGPSKRKSDEHKNWADIVIRSARPEHIYVFNEAWQEYLLAKQAAEESRA